MKILWLLFFIIGNQTQAHVPSLLLPIKGTPIASYFLGQSNISRAVYSELSGPSDFFVAHFYVASAVETRLELLTPVCGELPRYEAFQPSILILSGDLPWKNQAETNQEFLGRLESS
jgi:hypothetical protein